MSYERSGPAGVVDSTTRAGPLRSSGRGPRGAVRTPPAAGSGGADPPTSRDRRRGARGVPRGGGGGAPAGGGDRDAAHLGPAVRAGTQRARGRDPAPLHRRRPGQAHADATADAAGRRGGRGGRVGRGEPGG